VTDFFELAKRDVFASGMGIELMEASPGRAVARVTVGKQHLNFNGLCHGGLTFTLADLAFGVACNSHGLMAGGVDVHMAYAKPAQAGDVLTATAIEISRSSRLGQYRIDVVRGDGALVAAMTGTALVSGKKHA
jgi:phenylacetic acid degradation protein PaaD